MELSITICLCNVCICTGTNNHTDISIANYLTYDELWALTNFSFERFSFSCGFKWIFYWQLCHSSLCVGWGRACTGRYSGLFVPSCSYKQRDKLSSWGITSITYEGRHNPSALHVDYLTRNNLYMTIKSKYSWSTTLFDKESQINEHWCQRIR